MSYTSASNLTVIIANNLIKALSYPHLAALLFSSPDNDNIALLHLEEPFMNTTQSIEIAVDINNQPTGAVPLKMTIIFTISSVSKHP